MTIPAMTTDEIVTELQQRVKALYRLNAELAAQCDRLGKVVDAAVVWRRGPIGSHDALVFAVDAFEREMAQLAKESSNGSS